MKTCYIVGAGDNSGTSFSKEEYDILIAADGGLKTIEKLELKPDWIIGDFDSLGYVPDKENVIKYKVEKDMTDMMIAIEKAIELGCDIITIWGGTGGDRADHTLANISAMLYASQKDIDIKMIDKKYIYQVITDDNIQIEGTPQKDLSVFSLTEKSIITIEGAKYDVNNRELRNNMTLGVSNSFREKTVNIKAKGSILVMAEK